VSDGGVVEDPVLQGSYVSLGE